MFQELYRNKTWQHVGDAITANRGSQTHPGKALKRNWILQNTNTRESFIFYTTWILQIQNIGKDQARKKQWNIKRQVPDFKNFVTLQTLCKNGLSLFGTCLLFCRSSPPSYPGVRAVCLSALGTQLSRPLLYHVPPSSFFIVVQLRCNYNRARTDNLGETLVEKFDNFSRIPLSPPHGNFQLRLSTVSSRKFGKLEQNIQFHIFPS